jgi:hypothetical protein
LYALIPCAQTVNAFIVSYSETLFLKLLANEEDGGNAYTSSTMMTTRKVMHALAASFSMDNRH